MMDKIKNIHQKRLIKISIIAMTPLWCLLTLVIVWPLFSDLISSHSNVKLPEPVGVNYLVIAPQALEKSASAWADYRRSTGYQTRVILLPPGPATTQVIRDSIQNTFEQSGSPYPFYVLLIGHAHPLSSNPDTYLPAATFSIDPNQFSFYGADPIASDDGFVGEYTSGIPKNIYPMFIGRIPARTVDEGFLMLERTKAYEENPPVGEGRARIELVTSNAGFGPQYEPLFESMLKTLVQKLMPDEYTWHMLNGNPDSPYSYPSYLFPKEVAKRLDSGALAMVYIGHGQPELIAWAYSQDGSRSRIFGIEDASLIQNANDSLGIFTACSAGDYDLAGDNLSVIESIYLTQGGPVATYSSSAFINGTANGRLVVDLSEALLIDKAPTLGEWVGQIETRTPSTNSRNILTAAVKSVIPRISGLEGKALISSAKAGQVLDIQHATYNLFGDPALQIAYPQSGVKVRPNWLWQPWKGDLAFSGKSDLPAGQQVSVSLEIIPGSASSEVNQSIGLADRYLQANSTVIGVATASVEKGGNFSGSITIPRDAPGGKYLLRAVSVSGKTTYVSAHPVYTGWPPITELLTSVVFWWVLIGLLIFSRFGWVRWRRIKLTGI